MQLIIMFAAMFLHWKFNIQLDSLDYLIQQTCFYNNQLHKKIEVFMFCRSLRVEELISNENIRNFFHRDQLCTICFSQNKESYQWNPTQSQFQLSFAYSCLQSFAPNACNNDKQRNVSGRVSRKIIFVCRYMNTRI